MDLLSFLLCTVRHYFSFFYVVFFLSGPLFPSKVCPRVCVCHGHLDELGMQSPKSEAKKKMRWTMRCGCGKCNREPRKNEKRSFVVMLIARALPLIFPTNLPNELPPNKCIWQTAATAYTLDQFRNESETVVARAEGRKFHGFSRSFSVACDPRENSFARTHIAHTTERTQHFRLVIFLFISFCFLSVFHSFFLLELIGARWTWTPKPEKPQMEWSVHARALVCRNARLFVSFRWLFFSCVLVALRYILFAVLVQLNLRSSNFKKYFRLFFFLSLSRWFASLFPYFWWLLVTTTE